MTKKEFEDKYRVIGDEGDVTKKGDVLMFVVEGIRYFVYPITTDQWAQNINRNWGDKGVKVQLKVHKDNIKL